MSELSDALTTNIILADYINIDQSGKLNALGGGLQFIGFDPNTGMSTPFAVGVQMVLNNPNSVRDGSFELLLVDANGEPVAVPGPAGPQVLRVGQVVRFDDPVLPNVDVPRGAVPPAANVVLNFANGVPLGVGMSYQWRAQVDHEMVGSYSFYVPGPPPQPVLG